MKQQFSSPLKNVIRLLLKKKKQPSLSDILRGNVDLKPEGNPPTHAMKCSSCSETPCREIDIFVGKKVQVTTDLLQIEFPAGQTRSCRQHHCPVPEETASPILGKFSRMPCKAKQNIGSRGWFCPRGVAGEQCWLYAVPTRCQHRSCPCPAQAVGKMPRPGDAGIRVGSHGKQ